MAERQKFKMDVQQQKKNVKSETAYRSSLGAVHSAVRYHLGKRDDPVIDFVSSSSFD